VKLNVDNGSEIERAMFWAVGVVSPLFVVNASELGFALILGGGATERETPTVWGLFDATDDVIVIVPL
jgi:hypothetical protein